MTSLKRFSVTLALAVAGCEAIAAGDIAGFPAPGQYQIDSEAVTTIGSGYAASERTVRTDGATGSVTEILKSAVDDAHPVSRTVKGDGPVTWCVKAATAAPPLEALPTACQTREFKSTATGSSFVATCPSATISDSFHRLDAHVWERSFVAQPVAQAGVGQSGSAINVLGALPTGALPAEQVQAIAKAQASLPSATATDKVMADMREQMQTAIRSGSPEEAAVARQALAAMQGQGSADTSPLGVTHVHERWTLLSDNCSSKR